MKKLFAGAFALLMFISFTAATVSALPPGLAKRSGNLPPGLAKKIGTNELIPGLPPGLYKKIENLPPGILKQFFPTAELQRVSFDKRVEGVLESIVTRRDGDFVKLRRDSKFYEVDENAVIWIDDNERSLSRLREGMTVELKMKDEKVIQIEAESDEIVTGTIEAINNRNTIINVKSGNEARRYDIQGAELWIDGTRSRLTGLKNGMEVTLRIVEGKVVEIEAESQQIVNGTIEDINNARTVITVKSEDTTRRYDIQGAALWIDGVSSRLTGLEKGMEVTLKFEGDKVVEIRALSRFQIHEGVLRAKYQETIIVLVDNELKEFTLAEDVNLSRILVDDTILFQVENNEVFRIARK